MTPPSIMSGRFLEPVPPRVPTAAPGPTIVLLNDTRDQNNFGSEVLVDGLLRVIQDRVPTATIRPIPSHWMIGTANLAHIYQGRGGGFRVPHVTYPRVADQFEAVADDWFAGRGGRDAHHMLSRFDGADLVLLNGEGSIYRDNQSAVRELFLAWLTKERLGIPTVFANGMVHLTDVVPVVPAMARRTFGCLDAVVVREPRSLRNLQEWVPEVDGQLIPDSAFACSPEDARETDAVAEVRRRIGGAPYFVFDPGVMPIDVGRGKASALHQLITMLKADGRQAVLVRKDLTDNFLEEVAGETQSVYVTTLSDYREYMALTSAAEFVVSGRYHNTILASVTGCPTIALATTNHKVHGALEMVDSGLGAPFDGTYLRPDLEEISRRASEYSRDRSAWRERLLESCARRRVEVFELGDLVRDLLCAAPTPS